jgi:hypothetical protein
VPPSLGVSTLGELIEYVKPANRPDTPTIAETLPAIPTRSAS